MKNRLRFDIIFNLKFYYYYSFNINFNSINSKRFKLIFKVFFNLPKLNFSSFFLPDEKIFVLFELLGLKYTNVKINDFYIVFKEPLFDFKSFYLKIDYMGFFFLGGYLEYFRSLKYNEYLNGHPRLANRFNCQLALHRVFPYYYKFNMRLRFGRHILMNRYLIY